MLYTKVVVVHNKIGYAFRAVSVGSVVAAFVIFARLNKICFTKFDINVTYALLGGAICLDFIALIMLIFKEMRWFKDPEYKEEEVLGTCILIRRWSKSVSSFNLIKYCLRLRPYPLKNNHSHIK